MAMLLTELKGTAESSLQKTVTDCVISVRLFGGFFSHHLYDVFKEKNNVIFSCCVLARNKNEL